MLRSRCARDGMLKVFTKRLGPEKLKVRSLIFLLLSQSPTCSVQPLIMSVPLEM